MVRRIKFNLIEWNSIESLMKFLNSLEVCWLHQYKIYNIYHTVKRVRFCITFSVVAFVIGNTFNLIEEASITIIHILFSNGPKKSKWKGPLQMFDKFNGVSSSFFLYIWQCAQLFTFFSVSLFMFGHHTEWKQKISLQQHHNDFREAGSTLVFLTLME